MQSCAVLLPVSFEEIAVQKEAAHPTARGREGKPVQGMRRSDTKLVHVMEFRRECGYVDTPYLKISILKIFLVMTRARSRSITFGSRIAVIVSRAVLCFEVIRHRKILRGDQRLRPEPLCRRATTV